MGEVRCVHIAQPCSWRWIFLGNIEARWKFARFQFINNNFYLGLNGFLDFGRVTKKIDTPFPFASPAFIGYSNDYYDNDAEEMHYSYGAGLRVVMNQNFVVKLDYGMAADKRDGTSGIYIGLNYLF